MPQERLRADARGPSKAFCVRTCDGRYFPVRAHAGMSAAESCHSFCPASETRLYSGSNIDYATATDGSRYADMPNAFAYRKALVTGCTCNGRNAFGLAHIDAAKTRRCGQAISSPPRRAWRLSPVTTTALPRSRRSKIMRGCQKRRATSWRTYGSPAAVTNRRSGTDITASIPTVAANARAEASPAQTSEIRRPVSARGP